MESLINALTAPRPVEPRERPIARDVAPTESAKAVHGSPRERGTEPAETTLGSQSTDLEQISEIVDAVSEELTAMSSYRLDMAYDDEVSRFVVSLVDDKTGDTLRQFPPEQLLAAGKNLRELRGLLFDDKS